MTAIRIIDSRGSGFAAELLRLQTTTAIADPELTRGVADILADVRVRGDAALL